MKKIALILAAAVGISMAGPALNSWVPSGTSTPVWLITVTGSYAPNTTQAMAGFKVNVHTSSPTDTATFYLADANGVAKSDVVTVVGGASSYALAGGVERHWYLTGPWKLVLTKAVGIVRAEVEQ